MPLGSCANARFSATDPLVDCQEGEALARGRRAHDEVLARTRMDEFWLAGPTVIEEFDFATRISSASRPICRTGSGRDLVTRGMNFVRTATQPEALESVLLLEGSFSGAKRGGLRCAVQLWETRAR